MESEVSKRHTMNRCIFLSAHRLVSVNQLCAEMALHTIEVPFGMIHSTLKRTKINSINVHYFRKNRHEFFYSKINHSHQMHANSYKNIFIFNLWAVYRKFVGNCFRDISEWKHMYVFSKYYLQIDIQKPILKLRRSACTRSKQNYVTFRK